MYSVAFFQRRLRYNIIPYTIGDSLVFFFIVLFPFGRFVPETNFIRSLGHLLQDRYHERHRRGACGRLRLRKNRPHLTSIARNINSQPTKRANVFVVYLIFVSATSNKPCLAGGVRVRRGVYYIIPTVEPERGNYFGIPVFGVVRVCVYVYRLLACVFRCFSILTK